MSTWTGDPPPRCDLCQQPITTSFVDGRIKQGTAWGYLCLSCHTRYGVGLGTGKGQRYDKLTVGEATVWKKVAG